ncbi:type II toxin-antitoxin system VapC family toxin [Candidatus Methylobacter favarea]|nr:PIN domain nuclease [Candidatus Methylobacter favarea]
MILIDTSVWILIFKDKTGTQAERIQVWLDDREVVLSRFNQLELLQGCRDNKEWQLLSSHLEGQTYVEASASTWHAAARIYFDLRRQGLTVRSPIDCCIAQLALENDCLLLHNDKDFTVIHQIRPLHEQLWR